VWASVAAEQVGPRIVTAAAAVAALVRSGTGVATRSAPDRWSSLEYAAHVRDVLLHVRDRFVIGLVEDSPEFKPLYREERVGLGLYADDQPSVVADEVEVAAALFARTFNRIDAVQLQRLCQYAYPTVQSRSLLWMGQQVVHEAEHHLGDIEVNVGSR
jgi:hypothetical protein